MMMNQSKLLLISAALIFYNSCEKKSILLDGYLKGKISIGPICPIETIIPDSACMPTAETYKTYPVGIFSSDGKNKLAQIIPALNGSFIIELVPGSYVLKLESAEPHIGGSNLPIQVVVNSQDSTLFNITIDTGIR